MARRKRPNQVLAIVHAGFVAFWRGQIVRSSNKEMHFFPSEDEAWRFLRLCDCVHGVPAIAREAPYLDLVTPQDNSARPTG